MHFYSGVPMHFVSGVDASGGGDNIDRGGRIAGDRLSLSWPRGLRNFNTAAESTNSCDHAIKARAATVTRRWVEYNKNAARRNCLHERID